ncbi:hypothetical protein F1880_006560 [Penicillium rolfsii]|nr:hypothetical protein F1880_006560 [Penicillium rolfsii]
MHQIIAPYSRMGLGSFSTGEIIGNYFPYATFARQKISSVLLESAPYATKLKDSLHWIAYCKCCAAGSAQAFKA